MAGGNGGFIGTNTSANFDRTNSDGYDGVWWIDEVQQFVYSHEWATPADLPTQAVVQGALIAGPASGSIPIPPDCPHVLIMAGSGGGGGGVDFDNGQARNGGRGAISIACVPVSGISTVPGGDVINYNVGGGGNGAPARSNDGGGQSGGNTNVSFGNFNITANAGAGGCGKCGSNGAFGNSSRTGSQLFGLDAGALTTYASFPGPAGGTYVVGQNSPAFTPVDNIPVNTASAPPIGFSNYGSSNNGGGTGGSGGPGFIYVRFGRGINSSTAPAPAIYTAGDDYGVNTAGYTVPSTAKNANV